MPGANSFKNLADLNKQTKEREDAIQDARSAGKFNIREAAAALKNLSSTYERLRPQVVVAEQLQRRYNSTLTGMVANLTGWGRRAGGGRGGAGGGGAGGGGGFGLNGLIGNPTPRQLIAAFRGNIANTGRNVGLGLAAGVVSLGSAASPNGIEVIVGPLKMLAAVIGQAVLPYLVKFGAELMNAANREQAMQRNPNAGDMKPHQGFLVGVNAAAAGVLAGIATGNPVVGVAVGAAVGMGLTHAVKSRNLKESGVLGNQEERDLRNKQMILQSMQMALTSGASTGKMEGAWARIQSGMVMTPFEKEMMRIWQENLTDVRQKLGLIANGVNGRPAGGR